MITLPCLAVFDHHTVFWVHVGFAVTFFGSCSFYLIIVTNLLEKNLKAFPEEDHRGIRMLTKAKKILIFHCITLWNDWVNVFLLEKLSSTVFQSNHLVGKCAFPADIYWTHVFLTSILRRYCPIWIDQRNNSR